MSHRYEVRHDPEGHPPHLAWVVVDVEQDDYEEHRGTERACTIRAWNWNQS